MRVVVNEGFYCNSLRRTPVKSGLWYSLPTLSYYLSMSSNTPCTVYALSFLSTSILIFGQRRRNAGETFIILQMEYLQQEIVFNVDDIVYF